MIMTKSFPVNQLSGAVTIPGDKSISHRALLIGASAIGETKIEGLLEAKDVMATCKALRILGITIERNSDRSWSVIGRGVGGLREPNEILDLANSGTGVRLLMGLTAAHPFNTMLTGDTSLRTRPMDRVIGPLGRMGAVCNARAGKLLPLTIHGSDMLCPVTETMTIASAQVKSAILLAGLNIKGDTTIIEPALTRDHTENMLKYFGAKLIVKRNGEKNSITISGHSEFTCKNISIPGDISSAAFPLVATLIIPGSEIEVTRVGLNPLRTGLLTTLKEMGANIRIYNQTCVNGEPSGDIKASFSTLRGVTVPAERAPSMIDEYPILSVAAAFAKGKTVLKGVSELRVKESDRLKAITIGLRKCNVEVEQKENDLIIHGSKHKPEGGAQIEARNDHRIAMAFLIMGMASKEGVLIDDISSIETSFPNFVKLMKSLGANFQVQSND